MHLVVTCDMLFLSKYDQLLLEDIFFNLIKNLGGRVLKKPKIHVLLKISCKYCSIMVESFGLFYNYPGFVKK